MAAISPERGNHAAGSVRYNAGMSDSPSKSKSKRRWLQYSLRTFLILLTLFAVWFGSAMHKTGEQRKAVAELERLGGTGAVCYSYQYDEDNRFIKNAEPPGPAWLRDILGIDFMADVVGVELRMTKVSDLAPLAGLTNLR